MTLWGCANYGQNLQVYALQRFLRDAGHDAFLIRYPLIEYQDDRPIKWLKQFLKHSLPPFVLKIIYKFKGKKYKHSLNKETDVKFSFHRDPSYLIHLRAIGKFLDDYINQSLLFYPSISELKANPPEADAYITGSDQVWNFWGQPLSIAKRETLDAFFLNFGKSDIKRISYASSFGTRKIDNKSAEIIKPLIKSFSFISVREEEGLNLCKAFGCNNAQWVPDPTLLLDKSYYRSLYNESGVVKQNKPYCFIYMIRDNPFFLQNCYIWAQKNNLEIILITNSDLVQHDFKETFATIPEWLCLLDNAQYVFTDSYHGSIFSIIFNKLFGIIPFNNCENDLRLNDLFRRFNLQYPLLNDFNSFSFSSKTEMNKTELILGELYKKYSFDWFNNILSLNNE